jgi:hypothetical protein
MKFNLVVEIDDEQIADCLADYPGLTRRELEEKLNNACYLGMDCIDAILARQFGFGAGNTYVEK